MVYNTKGARKPEDQLRTRKNFLFSKATIRDLEALALETGFTQTQLIEMGVQRMSDYYRERRRAAGA